MAKYFSRAEGNKTGRWSVCGCIPTLERGNDTSIPHVMFERNTTNMTAKEIIKLAIFEGKQIRKIIHDGEWWFSVVDVVAVLSESPTPRQYWGKV